MAQNNMTQVIKAVQDGDRASFAKIVGEHQARLRTYMRVILWDRDQVDDLTQETFVTAYTCIDTYDSTRSEFYAWLKGIARNLAANANRRFKRRKSAHENYLAELRIERAWHASDEEAMSLDRSIKRLRTCFERLPDKLQSLFRDFYLAGKKVIQIAEESGKSRSAVKVALMRGRLILKACMQGPGEVVR
jgi:RNA polymerase sigma-70 factor, ECF subfamily